MNLPGINKKTFILKFTENYFNKKDILITENKTKLIVTSVPDLVWWKKLLRWLGFKITYKYEVKLKQSV